MIDIDDVLARLACGDPDLDAVLARLAGGDPDLDAALAAMIDEQPDVSAPIDALPADLAALAQFCPRGQNSPDWRLADAAVRAPGHPRARGRNLLVN